MTDKTANSDRASQGERSPVLSPVRQQFILHWGEMGARWGINRTVAQVHALLHLSEGPISADAIAAALGVARSNVSTSLRELQGWGIVRAVHVLGDRRVHYESLTNVWELFRTIVDQRKRREIDPTLQMLRGALDELDQEKSADRHTRERLQELFEFFDTMTELYDELGHLPIGALKTVARMRGKVRKLLGGGKA
jgi:DNA-binding transcriptional regulator GbsR (MarR family)